MGSPVLLQNGSFSHTAAARCVIAKVAFWLDFGFAVNDGAKLVQMGE